MSEKELEDLWLKLKTLQPFYASGTGLEQGYHLFLPVELRDEILDALVQLGNSISYAEDRKFD